MDLFQSLCRKVTGGHLQPQEFTDVAPATRDRSDSCFSTDSGYSDDGITLDPETGLELISLSEVSQHTSPYDGWIVLYDKVYEITEFLRLHPGGEEVLAEYLGYDGTLAFRGVGHSKAAVRMLTKYCIGILPREERLGFTM